ncbi:MAG: membrane protein insertase YidC, partial [Hyphomicrobiales bacterium]
MQQNRNYYLAIGLSVLIVFVWQFFYMGPKIEAQRVAEEARQAEIAKQQKANPKSTMTTTPAVDANGQPIPGLEGASDATIAREQA